MSDFKSYSLTHPPKYEKRYYRSKSLLLIDINNECGKRFKMKFDPQKLEHVSDNDLKIILKKLEMEFQSKTQDDFLLFVKSVWPDFIEGKHHIKYANQLQKVANGTLKRLIVNMPPRHTKSEFASYLFPAWFIGRNPKIKLMQTTHNAELAFRFGRKMKNLIDSPEYRQTFPDVKLAIDSKAAGRWDTNRGGEYFAAGVGGAITAWRSNCYCHDEMVHQGFDGAFAS
jgi:hypothetical protein